METANPEGCSRGCVRASKMVRTKPHRLPESAYRGQKTVSFTACIEGRRRVFTCAEVVEPLVALLENAVCGQDCAAPVYCFMPDHLHLLLVGRSSASRMKVAMDQFKRASAEWLLENLTDARWQKDYHDHIVRGTEDLGNHIRYLLENPVRAGMVEEWSEYPFSGSIGVDLGEYLRDVEEMRKFG